MSNEVDNLYRMEVGDVLNLSTHSVLKVIGGWIYIISSMHTGNVSSVYVPDNS